MEWAASYFDNVIVKGYFLPLPNSYWPAEMFGMFDKFLEVIPDAYWEGIRGNEHEHVVEYTKRVCEEMKGYAESDKYGDSWSKITKWLVKFKLYDYASRIGSLQNFVNYGNY